VHDQVRVYTDTKDRQRINKGSTKDQQRIILIHCIIKRTAYAYNAETRSIIRECVLFMGADSNGSILMHYASVTLASVIVSHHHTKCDIIIHSVTSSYIMLVS
jgi:hypothetical protein